MKRRFIALGAVLSLLVVSSPVQATIFPGKNGQIIFTNASGLWRISAEGGVPERLVKGIIQSPSASPDGRTIAYVEKQGSFSPIALLDRSGRQKSITSGYIDAAPAWSADGKHLAFIRQQSHRGGRQALVVVSLQSMKERFVVDWLPEGKAIKAFSWAPDSKRIVYEQADSGGNNLKIVDTKTNRSHQLTEVSDNRDHALLAWSPSGRKITFNDTNDEVYTIWPDGSRRAVISDGDSYDASWSPDGKRIAFLEDRMGDQITLSEEDGTLSWITIDKAGYQTIGPPVWSPDGTQLVLTLTDKPQDPKASAVFLLKLNQEGEKIVKLYDGPAANLNWQVR